MNRIWKWLTQQFGAAGRWGVVVGTLLIVLTTAGAGYALLRADYQVLFSDLGPQDAATLTAELERLKVPYTLEESSGGAAADGATSILVDRRDVYKTRIKLMGKDLPLHGAVGFELFNNGDLGMTEFSQKINYQRALQGELTRTILDLNEVRDARVLLVLPEQSFLRQTSSKPKASVTLSLKQSRRLMPEQVVGIQRLVASSVPGIVAEDVTIVDQRGVALNRNVGDAAGGNDVAAGLGRLDVKRETEAYLTRKANEVLGNALGEGQAHATVDVTLNMDRVQSNSDELISPPSRDGVAPTGVVTRERESAHDTAMATTASATTTGAAPQTGNGATRQREVDYALGHRVEQVVSAPGSIRSVDIAVVIRRHLTPQQTEHIKQMVAAAVGAQPERGDSVVVQTLDDLGLVGSADAATATQNRSAVDPAGIVDLARAAEPAPAGSSGLAVAGERSDARWVRFLSLGLIALVLLALLLWAMSRRGSRVAARLSDADRRQLLRTLEAWLAEAPPTERSVPKTTA